MKRNIYNYIFELDNYIVKKVYKTKQNLKDIKDKFDKSYCFYLINKLDNDK